MGDRRSPLWFLRAPQGRDPRLPGGTAGNKSADELTPPPRGKAGIVIDDDDGKGEPAAEEEATDRPKAQAAPAADPAGPLATAAAPPAIARAVAAPTVTDLLRHQIMIARAEREGAQLVQELRESVGRLQELRWPRRSRPGELELRAWLEEAQERAARCLGLAERVLAPVLESVGVSQPVPLLGRRREHDSGAVQELREFVGRLHEGGEDEPAKPFAAVVDPRGEVAMFDLTPIEEEGQERSWLRTNLIEAQEAKRLVGEAVYTLPEDEQRGWALRWAQVDKPDDVADLIQYLIESVRRAKWTPEKVEALNLALAQAKAKSWGPEAPLVVWVDQDPQVAY